MRENARIFERPLAARIIFWLLHLVNMFENIVKTIIVLKCWKHPMLFVSLKLSVSFQVKYTSWTRDAELEFQFNSHRRKKKLGNDLICY